MLLTTTPSLQLKADLALLTLLHLPPECQGDTSATMPSFTCLWETSQGSLEEQSHLPSSLAYTPLSSSLCSLSAGSAAVCHLAQLY